MKKYILFLFILSSIILNAKPDVPVPKLQGRINDLTHTLTDSESLYLEAILKSFEDSTGNQIVVLMIPTTGNETIEDYSMRVAESWKIGQKGIDNGVILLIAKDDRKLRIEVGYGLESTITDAYAYRVINNYIVPEFKNGNFYSGIYFGINEIIKLINGNSILASIPESYYSDPYTETEEAGTLIDKHPGLLGLIILLSIFLPFGMLFFINKKIYVKIIASTVLIVFSIFSAFAMGSFIYLIAFGMTSFIFIIMSFIKFKGSGSGTYYSSNSYNSSSSYSSNSSSSSYSSGSSSSYSGGGGSFGGGGASGSW